MDRVISPHHVGDVRSRLPHRCALARSPRATATAAAEKRAHQQGRAGEDEGVTVSELVDLLPLTIPEVRRLLFVRDWQPPPAAEHVLRWSTWRRRHQAYAKLAHIKRHQRRM